MPARILIIEDNPTNLELMSYLLKAFGHALLTADDGEQGLATARREKPDLIVCDIQLPGMDGHAIARQIRTDAVLRAIPVVAVTASAMVGDRDKVLASGFNGYISKPIDPETFVPNVEAFLRPDQRSTRAAPRVSAPAASPARTKHGTILVVDDQPVNLSLKRSILEPQGYGVLAATGMAQALELAHQTPPDLILSDLNMSDGSGFDFIKAIRADARLKNIPFIFVTSTYCNEIARSKGLALGAAVRRMRQLCEDLLAGPGLSVFIDEAKVAEWVGGATWRIFDPSAWERNVWW